MIHLNLVAKIVYILTVYFDEINFFYHANDTQEKESEKLIFFLSSKDNSAKCVVSKKFISLSE